MCLCWLCPCCGWPPLLFTTARSLLAWVPTPPCMLTFSGMTAMVSCTVRGSSHSVQLGSCWHQKPVQPAAQHATPKRLGRTASCWQLHNHATSWIVERICSQTGALSASGARKADGCVHRSVAGLETQPAGTAIDSAMPAMPGAASRATSCAQGLTAVPLLGAAAGIPFNIINSSTATNIPQGTTVFADYPNESDVLAGKEQRHASCTASWAAASVERPLSEHASANMAAGFATDCNLDVQPCHEVAASRVHQAGCYHSTVVGPQPGDSLHSSTATRRHLHLLAASAVLLKQATPQACTPFPWTLP